MTFVDPRWLWGLVLLPALALVEWRAAVRARRALATLVGTRPDHALLAQRRPGERRLGAALRLGALALLTVGAAQPEWGREVVRRAATGSDVVLMLDVSASMDARDVPPSRLAEARREALAVVDRLGGSRIAVLAFAGDAVRLSPLTLDRGTVRLTLEGLSSGAVSEPGTDLGRALRAAMKVMPAGRREEQAIVLWTDGEDLEQGGVRAIDDVQRSGIRVFVVGVGTPAGDVVPALDGAGRTVDVKRDAEGRVVRSRLDEALLRTLARRTHGGYFAALRPGGELPRLLGALGTLARSGRGQRSVERPVARFPLFAAGAALLLALERLRPRRRAGAGRGRAPAAARAVKAAGCVVVCALAGAAPAAAQSAWARGDAAWRKGDFAAAESLYARRLARGAPDEVRVNLASARARAGRAAEAEAQLGALAGRAGRVGGTARYNLGTLLAGERRDDEALRTLRTALERDPSDEDARWNYEVLLRRREQRRSSSQQTPQGGGGQQPEPDGGGGAPRPDDPRAQSPPTPSPAASTPPPTQTPPSPSGRPQRMDRAQADRLLNSLQDLARLEQQRQRRAPVARDRRGKDW